MSETAVTSVSNILDLLSTLEKESTYNVYLPSKQKEVKFKQLTTEQLKRILKTVVDSPYFNTEFIVTINSIIKENLVDTDITDLNVYDKVLFLLKTRIENISSKLTITFSDDEIEENNLESKTHDIQLDDILRSFVKQNINIISESYGTEAITVTCDLPSLITENKLEKELHKDVNFDITTPEELRTVVGDTFVNEITKFISNITLNGNSFDFNTLSFKERLSIVEKLPANIINNVLKYIENYRKLIKPVTEVTISLLNKEQKEITITKDIPLDATLFNV